MIKPNRHLSAKNEQAVNAGAVVISVDDQVNKENQKPKEFNAAEFKRQLKGKNKLREFQMMNKPVRNFIKDDSGVNAITDDTKKNVGSARDEVVSDTKKIGSAETANPEAKNEIYSRPGTEYQPEPSGAKPVIGNPARAVPKPAADEDLQMDEEHNADSLDKEMEKNEMTDDQLAESEEPKFIDTLKEKQTAQKEICQVPGKLKDAETTKLQQSTGDAKHVLDKDMNSMFAERDGQLKNVAQGQKDVTSEEEQKLKDYYSRITLIHAEYGNQCKKQSDLPRMHCELHF